MASVGLLDLGMKRSLRIQFNLIILFSVLLLAP